MREAQGNRANLESIQRRALRLRDARLRPASDMLPHTPAGPTQSRIETHHPRGKAKPVNRRALSEALSSGNPTKESLDGLMLFGYMDTGNRILCPDADASAHIIESIAAGQLEANSLDGLMSEELRIFNSAERGIGAENQDSLLRLLAYYGQLGKNTEGSVEECQTMLPLVLETALTSSERGSTTLNDTKGNPALCVDFSLPESSRTELSQVRSFINRLHSSAQATLGSIHRLDLTETTGTKPVMTFEKPILQDIQEKPIDILASILDIEA